MTTLATCAAGNIFTILLWVVWFAVLFYVQAKSADFKVFDPYEILNLERGATEKEIKKAYRQMSLKFHPDKVSSDAACPATGPAAGCACPDAARPQHRISISIAELAQAVQLNTVHKQALTPLRHYLYASSAQPGAT
jgi:hypothetical protein